jgi:hypothetical protein
MIVFQNNDCIQNNHNTHCGENGGSIHDPILPLARWRDEIQLNEVK